MPRTSIKKQFQHGFTVVEILVVLTVLGILIPLVIGTLSDFYNSNSDTLVKTVQNGDVQTALKTIEKDVNTAERFLVSNTIIDPGSSTSWLYSGTGITDRRLILSTYATTALASNDASASRQLLFSTGTCLEPLKNNLVYFVNGGNLYRRTIKNTAPSCTGSIAQKQTCAAGNTAASCQGVDALLASNVTGFSIDYFETPSTTTAYSEQYTAGGNVQSIIESTATKTIAISLDITRKSNGVNSIAKSTLRMARQN